MLFKQLFLSSLLSVVVGLGNKFKAQQKIEPQQKDKM